MVTPLSNFDTAVSAYRDKCDRDGLDFRQPDEAFSKQINDVVYLRTSAVGYVARYDTRRRCMLV